MNFETKSFNLNADDKTLVIAEVGVNHNGSIEIAKQMVDQAILCGADIVKFQAFKSDREISRFAAKTPYQKETTSDSGNQLEMCQKLELSEEALIEMKAYCAEKKVPFLCTAFEQDSLHFLVNRLNVSTIKIPSSEVTNIPFLEEIGRTKKAAILSTGASNLVETGLAIEALLKNGCSELMVFHCVSSYPAPFDQVNLRAMETIRSAFGVPVGFSDHTLGPAAAIAAAALGAAAVEKHFTLDCKMEGPDHRASIEPTELKQMVDGIRIARQVLGDGVKRPVPCELDNLPLIRKSIVADKNLPQGTILRPEHLTFKRPEGGIAPGDFHKILGLKLKRSLSEDEILKWEDL